MASLIKKIIRGRPYYYARVCQRVEASPKSFPRPISAVRTASSTSSKSGAPAAARGRRPRVRCLLLALARRLRLVDFIDRHAPKRGSGPSVGLYLLVAALNRCLAPCSKAALARWFDSTGLLPVHSSQLSSQRFWDNMQRVSADAITAIEGDLARHRFREFGLDLPLLFEPPTSSPISSFNDSELAQRGHSKPASRCASSASPCFTADARLPLLHRTYPGNRPDAPMFQSVADDLAKRCRDVGPPGPGASPWCSIRATTRRRTWIGCSARRSISSAPWCRPSTRTCWRWRTPSCAAWQTTGCAGVRAYRTERAVFGVRRTVLVTWNRKLFDAQRKTLLREIEKRRQLLRALQRQLRRWRDGKIRRGRKPGVAGAQKKVDGWLKARHMADLFRVQVRKENGLPKVNYRFQRRAWEKLQRTLLGKTLIFT